MGLHVEMLACVWGQEKAKTVYVDRSVYEVYSARYLFVYFVFYLSMRITVKKVLHCLHPKKKAPSVGWRLSGALRHKN